MFNNPNIGILSIQGNIEDIEGQNYDMIDRNFFLVKKVNRNFLVNKFPDENNKILPPEFFDIVDYFERILSNNISSEIEYKSYLLDCIFKFYDSLSNVIEANVNLGDNHRFTTLHKILLSEGFLMREEYEKQENNSLWAVEMQNLLMNLYKKTEKGTSILSKTEAKEWGEQYDLICQRGEIEEPIAVKSLNCRGRPKKTKS